jgi:hypothetical protein
MLAGEVPAGIGAVPVVGPIPGTLNLTLTIGLPLTNQVELQTLIANLYDPSSPQYRQYLTPAAFGAAFGAQADYDTLIDFVQSNGLSVASAYPSRTLLAVTGTASAIENAFFVNLNMYERTDGSTFYAPSNPPSANLAASVLHITGFDSETVATPADGSGYSGCGIQPTQKNYVGFDMRTAYLPCAPAALDGTGQSIALVEADSYELSDIQLYASTWLPPGFAPNLMNVQVPPTAPPFAPNTSSQTEVPQDIEMVMDMAPHATILVYEQNTVTSTSPVVVAPNFDMILAQIAGDNAASIISSSWIWESPVLDPNIQGIFEQFAVQGQSFFQAAGDGGSYYSLTNSGPGVPEPIIDSSLITVVGGTLLTTGPLASPPRSETTWNDTNPTHPPFAGGGGFANTDQFIDQLTMTTTTYPTLPIPTYQLNVNSSNLEIVGDPSNPLIPGNVLNARMIPDVSIVADEFAVVYSSCTFNGTAYCPVQTGTSHVVSCASGTSLAAPLWAGFAALANQSSATGRIGFANPALYALASINNASYVTNFLDIQDGSNNNLNGTAPFQYHAVAGYDLATGLGSPQCALVGQLGCVTCGVAGGTCINLDTDATNCGQCGNVCATGDVCCAGSCVDLQADPSNCGACAHTCGGSTCAASVCSPVTLAAGLFVPAAIAVSGGTVCWTTGYLPVVGGGGTPIAGTVMCEPTGGGSSTTLWSSSTQTNGLAIDANNAYFTYEETGGLGVVQQVPLVGGGPGTSLYLTPPLNGMQTVVSNGIAVDSTSVYFGAGAGLPLLQVPIGGGTVVTLASGAAAFLLAVDASRVYYTGNGIVTVPIAGGTPVTLAADSQGAHGMAIDGTSVYWTDEATSSVEKIAKAGPASVPTVLASVLGTGIAVDGTNVYFATGSVVAQVPVGGGPMLIIANGQSPEGVAVDATSVYWTDSLAGTVMKVFK